MGNEAAAFDCENKSLRSFIRPAPQHFESGQPVERGVDLDCGKLGGVELELSILGQLLGVEILFPTLVRPAARADKNLAHTNSHCALNIHPPSAKTQKVVNP